MNTMYNITIEINGDIYKACFFKESTIGSKIYHDLPITSKINTWGDELYFPINLNVPLSRPVEVVSVGDIAYSQKWKAFCIFYGKTPMSNQDKIIPNGPVEIIGRLDEDTLTIKRLLFGFFKEKKRRIFNRVPGLLKFAESITIDQLDR